MFSSLLVLNSQFYYQSAIIRVLFVFIAFSCKKEKNSKWIYSSFDCVFVFFSTFYSTQNYWTNVKWPKEMLAIVVVCRWPSLAYLIAITSNQLVQSQRNIAAWLYWEARWHYRYNHPAMVTLILTSIKFVCEPFKLYGIFFITLWWILKLRISIEI